MTIALKDFMTQLVRESRYGVVANLGNPGDQPTADILAAINMRLVRIWSAATWPWAREKLAFAMVVGQNFYTVTSQSGNAIDRILELIPNDPTVTPLIAGKPLSQMTVRDFFNRRGVVFTAPGVQAPGVIQYGLPEVYCNVGQDANGHWQIILDPAPDQVFTMSGWGKGVLTQYVNADVVANNPIKYFPNGVVLDSLFEGVMGDIAFIQGNRPAAEASNAIFDKKVKTLAGEQVGADKDDSPITTPPPARIVRRMSCQNRVRRT